MNGIGNRDEAQAREPDRFANEDENDDANEDDCCKRLSLRRKPL